MSGIFITDSRCSVRTIPKIAFLVLMSNLKCLSANRVNFTKLDAIFQASAICHIKAYLYIFECSLFICYWIHYASWLCGSVYYKYCVDHSVLIVGAGKGDYTYFGNYRLHKNALTSHNRNMGFNLGFITNHEYNANYRIPSEWPPHGYVSHVFNHIYESLQSTSWMTNTKQWVLR